MFRRQSTLGRDGARLQFQFFRPLDARIDHGVHLYGTGVRGLFQPPHVSAHHWKEAMNQFAILYAERFTREA
jgi:hypothetical protein